MAILCRTSEESEEICSSDMVSVYPFPGVYSQAQYINDGVEALGKSAKW
jgi:hypothetical protein